MVRTHANITDDIELILADTGNTFFNATTMIAPAIISGLKDMSDIVPFNWTHWLTASNKSRNIDTSSVDIICANWASYPVLLVDTDGDLVDDEDIDLNRRNVINQLGQIRLKLDSAPTPSETDDLTGTVTFTASSTAVTGSGTAFTTELRAGYYVKAGSNWYRVASVTDDTNLVLATNCATADAGADASCSYWRNDVLVNCDKVHYLTTQADLAGALVGAHSLGAWSLSVDNLGTGQIDKGTLLTIAGVEEIYLTRADATITTNAATLLIEPALKGIAPDNAVVTLLPSSLKPNYERPLAELCAGNLAINWVGEARTLMHTDALGHIDTGDDLLNTITVAANAENDYLSYASARLGIANSLIGLSQWGWNKRNAALIDFERMRPSTIYRTYSRT